MGWFEEQIEERVRNDNDAVSQAFARMGGVIMGKTALEAAYEADYHKVKDAIDVIYRFYHIKTREIPDNMTDINEILEFEMRPFGIMRRRVVLREDWYKDAIGAMLGTTKDGEVIALIPNMGVGYYYYDVSRAKKIKVNKKTAKNISGEAYCFYRPLPLKAVGIKDLLIYILRTLSVSDFVLLGIMTAAVTFVGFLSPAINNYIFNQAIGSGSMMILNTIAVMLAGAGIASIIFNAIRSLVLSRIQTKMEVSVEAAGMMRVLSLPASFFREYSSGELSNRVSQLNQLCSMLVNTFIATGITSLFSLSYIFQMSSFAPELVIPAMIIVLATFLLSVTFTFMQMGISKRRMMTSAREEGISYSLIAGVQKIRLSGAENRAFAKWADAYSRYAQLSYNPPLFLKINSVVITAVSLLGTIVMYFISAKAGVSVSDYIAFTISFGLVSGAFSQLAGMSSMFANIKPVYEMIKPVLKAVPEVSLGKRVITSLKGGVELSNVSFRYSENMPLVVDNLSLKIKSGQYIAIVGKTGCGKSTLMRLLLGFEKPSKGAIYYDGNNMDDIDLKSLHQKMGVVTQDGKLFSGDIYSNIVISAPQLTLKDAWEAAEMAGIADDIRDMPMGMHTIIAENGGISGGQKQRLMIARAVAAKPSILMFDEATSALDNITQKHISESLDNLKCTRIVIAHRLSTIRHCDRILVLDGGKLIEDGDYEELIARNGFFAELVKRQRLDTEQPIS